MSGGGARRPANRPRTGIFLHAPQAFARPIAWLGGLNRLRRFLYLGTILLTAGIVGHIYFTLTDSVAKLKSIFTGVYETSLRSRIKAWWGTLTAGI